MRFTWLIYAALAVFASGGVIYYVTRVEVHVPPAASEKPVPSKHDYFGKVDAARNPKFPAPTAPSGEAHPTK